MSDRFAVTKTNRVRQLKDKADYDTETVHRILDAGIVAHVAFIQDGEPVVVPMIYGRQGNTIYLHGARKARVIRLLEQTERACMNVTLLDGIVYARSVFNSSMNYRSLMVLGTATLVSDDAEKKRGLDILVEHLLPGRLADLRPSTRKEINATTLLSLPLETWSIKVGKGPPDDTRSDIKTPIWAGVVPLKLKAGKPQAAPDMVPGMPLPDYLKNLD